MTVLRLRAWLSLGGLGLLAAGFWVAVSMCGTADPPQRTFLQDSPLIVLAAPDAAAWVRLERASGATVRVGTLDELVARPAGIVPAGVALSSADHQRIHTWVAEGGRLVSPHPDLIAGLGLARGPAVSIEGAPIPEASERAVWPQAANVAGLIKGKGLKSLAPVISEKGASLVAEARLGWGYVLGLAIDPMADGRAGYELFPLLGREVAAWTKAPKGPERTSVEVYLDPGSLPDNLKKDPEATAQLLASAGSVQVAGWNFGFRDPANDYDYALLIAALHARGILVYAWLEPPFVNLLMWEDHPECREKTATGRDAMVDWRALMALEDPQCFELAWQQWTQVLTRFDWDGINVAELYFEPSIKMDNFTPYHPSALALFGGEPSKEPERFFDFRTELVTQLSAKMLTRIRALPRGAELDLEMTVIDDQLDPAHARAVGSNVARLAEVATQHGATLQVEDPFTTWTEGPLRYEALAASVVRLLPAGKVFLDINVVKRDGARPTAAMTGGELDLAVMAAARANSRLAIFSAATIGSRDFPHLAMAMAGSAETVDTGVIAPAALTVFAPRGPSQARLTIDGQLWPSAAGKALIPSGEHRLEWAESPSPGPALLHLAAEIGGASVTSDTMTVRYFARSRGFAVVDREPIAIEIDGKPSPLTAVVNPAGGYTVTIPAGTHELVVRVAAPQ